MTTTSHLNITHIEQSQDQKEVTANEAFDILDDAMNNWRDVALSDANTTLSTTQQYRSAFLKFTGTLTATRTITFQTEDRMISVWNATNKSLQFQVGGGSPNTLVTVASGEIADLACDASSATVVKRSSANASGVPLDLATFNPGTLSASQLMLQFAAVRSTTFPAGLAGSQGYAKTPPAAQTDVDIQVNGISKGTVRFNTGSPVGTVTFIFANAVTLVPGDILTLIAPLSPDGALADVSITLVGYR
jgi:hypothetical protein